MITLRELIKNKGLTNKCVSDALNISPTNIQRYDDLSKRNLYELNVISKALDMELSELISMAIDINIELKSPSPKKEPTTDTRLLTLIESQQRTIEKQASTIENLSKK